MLLIKRPDKITLKNNKNHYTIDYKLGRQAEEKYFQVVSKSKDNKDVKEMLDKTIWNKDFKDAFQMGFVIDMFDIDLHKAIITSNMEPINKINRSNYKKSVKLNSNKRNKNVTRFPYFISTFYNKDDEKTEPCQKEQLIQKYNLVRYLLCFDVVEKKGNALFNMSNICDSKSIELIYLGLLLFQKVNVYISPFYDIYLYLEVFDPLIEKKTLLKDEFSIIPKPDFDLLNKYLHTSFKERIKLYNTLLNEQYHDYMEQVYSLYVQQITYLNIEPKKYSKQLEFINEFVFKSFKNTFDGNQLTRVHSSVNFKEGQFIYDMIKKHDYKKCAEVGLAFGISAMYILHAIQNYRNNFLISIDPCQTEQWKNMGLKLIKEVSLSKNHTLIEEKSYTALPKLLEEYGEGSFDFIFIDGWHTFDYTLVDFFYADLLVKVDGMIIVDDVLHRGVNKFEKYIKSNYGFYKQLHSPKTVGCFKKLSKDDRDWDFHKDF